MTQRQASPAAASLYSRDGQRKYLTPSERARFLAAAANRPPTIETLCLTLVWTGCRISEALDLTRADLDVDDGIVAVRCLKKRRPGIVREVPVPSDYLASLLDVHPPGPPHERLWGIARNTAWRYIKDVMQDAGIVGVAASPKACAMLWCARAALRCTTELGSALAGPRRHRDNGDLHQCHRSRGARDRRSYVVIGCDEILDRCVSPGKILRSSYPSRGGETRAS